MVHLLWRVLRAVGLRREREDADGRRPTPETGMRRLLTLLGLVGVAYAIARRLGVDAVPSAGEVRRTAGDALPGDAHEITIREPGEADEEGDDGTETDAEAEAGEPTEADLPAEAVEERTVEDPDAEPAEPGEMTVDEEISEDVLDEDAESGESASSTESDAGEGDDDESEGGADRYSRK
ncbi:hypothetical protein [Halomicrobium urmianum]|uniref:hypothetical protein n=1 Tax=Halomicrobium urmianum TaxID=1586233 RepID=UPI001CDA3E54|nr:hypothetical protein [Halomicrobium urmianum]